MESDIDKFKNYLKIKGRSKSTIIAYYKDIKQLEKFVSPKIIQEINKRDLNKFLKYLEKKKGFSPKTISRKINSIRTFFGFLEIEGKIQTNPSASLNHPKHEDSPPPRLSKIEYKAIRDTARESIRVYTIIELMLQAGLKIGEISRLKLQDLKLESTPPHIFIREYATNNSRIIEINEVAYKALKYYLKARQNPKGDKKYLFNTKTGNPMLIRNIRTSIDRVFEKAGVTGKKVNDLRNTFICHQIERGVSLETIAKYVGHKSLVSTENYLKTTERKTPGTLQEIFAL